MAIVGFEYHKIIVEKKEAKDSSINIGNNIAITEVVKNNLKVGSAKQHGVKFIFEYTSAYEPDFAKITLGGSVVYLNDEKTTKSVLDDWDKKKQIDKDIAQQVINSILTKCNIQSIILANTVNLPPPVPMPKVSTAPKPMKKVKSGDKDDKKDSEGSKDSKESKDSKK